jgi:hypothetical protein
VHGDLVEMTVLAQGGQGFSRSPVQAASAKRIALLVHHLAHERVGELEPVWRTGRP